MALEQVIEVSFDPLLRVGDVVLRWQTLGLMLAILAAIALALLVRARARRHAAPGALRLDDFLLIVLGVVPGAVVGGRIVHGLAYWHVYGAQPERLLDPQLGSLSLAGAVVGGALSGALAGRLLGAPVGRWADIAALPMLVALGLGKLAQFLGGSGQGAAFDGPLAVAFVGAGPWIGRDADLPAHASQVYEGTWLILGLVLLAVAAGFGLAAGSLRRGGGSLLVLALGWFFVGRLLVGFTWRDEAVLGPLNAEQVAALLVLAVLAIVGVLGSWRAARHSAAAD